MPRLKSKLWILAAIFCVGISVGCSSLPPFPDVEVKLVDVQNAKLHRYLLPKQRGQDPQYLGSIPLDVNSIERNFTIAPSEYSKVEEYIGSVEDWAKNKCGAK